MIARRNTPYHTAMAQLSLGESRWRMVRRVLRKKRFTYADARNMTRHDQQHFDWLVRYGFFVAVGGEAYEVTEKGKGAADLGLYEYEPTRPRPGGGRGPGRTGS